MSELTINPELEQSTQDTPQVQLREVTINGRTFSVPQDVATALEEREREFQRKLSEQASELRARWEQQTAEPAKQNTDVLEGLDTLLFENPKAALQKLRESIVTEVTSLYQADQGRRQFWVEFYQDYPELRKHQTLVSAILQQRLPEWATVPTTAAKKLLADEVKRELVEIAKTITPVQGRTYTEEQRSAAPRPTASEAPAPPKSLSQVLKERRAKHRPAVPVL